MDWLNCKDRSGETVNTEEQRAHAENALAVSIARFPHKDTAKKDWEPRRLIEPLKKFFDDHLEFAENPKYPLTAMENVVAARTIVDTAYILGAIDHGPWIEYVEQCNRTKMAVIQVEMQPTA